MSIKTISLSGTAEEIGFQHGKLLSVQIHRNIDFYKSIFLNNFGDQSQILRAAQHFKERIQVYNPNFATEIDHIALGAGISEPLWVYGINSRTELSMMTKAQECTAIVCPKKRLIGQTWDWAQKLEGNFVIMKISFPNGHKILQLCEAGIIGKIGLNNNGLGVTLNYLFCEGTEPSTIPIHVVLRQILESRTLEDAKNAVRKSDSGKASNIIIAQLDKAVDIEFAGNIMEFYEIDDGEIYVHTNHYLHTNAPILADEESLLNSNTRFNTAMKSLGNPSTCDSRKMIEVLSDQSNGTNAILAKYKPDAQGMLGYYGTLATIIMDLRKRTMLVRKGNPSNTSFSMKAFDEVHCD